MGEPFWIVLDDVHGRRNAVEAARSRGLLSSRPPATVHHACAEATPDAPARDPASTTNPSLISGTYTPSVVASRRITHRPGNQAAWPMWRTVANPNRS